LIINQVTDRCTIKHHYLKSYKNRVKDILEDFLALNFKVVRGCHNTLIDQLAYMAANYEVVSHSKFRMDIKLVFRPSVPNNDCHW